ncbi:MAG: SRPBCC family protein [Alphaproteobacteria bacterium]
MADTILTKTAFFAASRETVWSFLTDKDKLALWFHQADADLAPGQDYALVAKSDDGEPVKQCWGQVLEMKPPTSLVYTFTIKPLGGATTTVTWTLEETHGGTKLTLKHEGIGEAAGAAALGLLMALDAGWDAHLARLRAALK